MSLRIHSVTVDCADNQRVAAFWAAALGLEIAGSAAQYVALSEPPEGSPRLVFQQVPEPKPGKNRLHLDIHADDRETEVARLLTLGARRGDELDEHGCRWTTMYDVEGNEFCVEQA